MQTSTTPRTITESLREYGRGLLGGLIFSVPMFATGEVWEAGAAADRFKLGVGLLGTVALLLGYNRFVGLHPDQSFAEVAIDSVEELGIGIVVAAVLLWLFGAIDATMARDELIGIVFLSGLFAAIGVSIGTAQLGEEAAAQRGSDEREPHGVLGVAAVAVCGAVIVVANIAPTEEITEIAARLVWWQEALVALASLGLIATALLLPEQHDDERLSFPLTLLVMYLIALVAATALRWLFGSFDDRPLAAVAQESIVLGLPAAIGAAVGKLLLK